MIYVIMCGGDLTNSPKQLSKVCGEELVARTIRLLRENGIEDIYITSHNPIFDKFGVPRIEHQNNFSYKDKYKDRGKKKDNYWLNAYVQLDMPVTYLHGDVFYSPEAIKTIVESKTDDILFFSTAKPFAKTYTKDHVEPLGYKVVNYERFHNAIKKAKRLFDEGKCWRHPISYELWAVLKGVPTEIDYFIKQTADVFGEGFVPICDYTCDVDFKSDIKKIEGVLR